MPFSIRNGVLGHADHPVRQIPSPNHSGPFRRPPRFVVMHYTAGASARGSAAWLANPASGASAHLVIGREGEVLQCVNFENRAWHAGRSTWQGLSGLNDHAIGIELANWGPLAAQDEGWASPDGKPVPAILARHRHGGPECGWERYPAIQLETAAAIVGTLAQAYPIREILGHDDIAPTRKRDPGPAFDMADFRKTVFGDLPCGTVTAHSLNVRSGPALSFPVIDTLARGARVSLGERHRDWIAIAPERWVFAGYLA
ncbi:N-acetylmuramoyl-L-alanine amidase [Novosphingobium profundi]|uniref:N-acetylmuramoyl-L-alanine amidase n=1 Tax=Novosphingobium profundi TaxID=1774954 RepID=UPI001BD934D9|nr:N-acetylmuramoyl-L-alanine amidase [Novosphingobium profundi]MBT0667645.1 N-acetylmuramoyl-L-alanine amidase [Novosphingobium profundi]